MFGKVLFHNDCKYIFHLVHIVVHLPSNFMQIYSTSVRPFFIAKNKLIKNPCFTTFFSSVKIGCTVTSYFCDLKCLIPKKATTEKVKEKVECSESLSRKTYYFKIGGPNKFYKFYKR